MSRAGAERCGPPAAKSVTVDVDSKPCGLRSGGMPGAQRVCAVPAIVVSTRARRPVPVDRHQIAVGAVRALRVHVLADPCSDMARWGRMRLGTRRASRPGRRPGGGVRSRGRVQLPECGKPRIGSGRSPPNGRGGHGGACTCPPVEDRGGAVPGGMAPARWCSPRLVLDTAVRAHASARPRPGVGSPVVQHAIRGPVCPRMDVDARWMGRAAAERGRRPGVIRHGAVMPEDTAPRSRLPRFDGPSVREGLITSVGHGGLGSHHERDHAFRTQ